MTDGYVEFEFDLPEALLAKLVKILDAVEPAPLLSNYVNKIPEEQGVYQLILVSAARRKLVYIGKTDSEAGLRKRLSRHAEKIHHRSNLEPSMILFKAVRIYVFTAIDLETQLIQYYGGVSEVNWNGSGFGSNDPGVERDTTRYKADHFDTRFPIDIGLPLPFSIPDKGTAAEILRLLKRQLPYLIRFQRPGKSTKYAHEDLEITEVSLDPSGPRSAESIIRQIVEQLPSGWHATMLPSHIIIYKNDVRKFPSGRLLARSAEEPIS